MSRRRDQVVSRKRASRACRRTVVANADLRVDGGEPAGADLPLLTRSSFRSSATLRVRDRRYEQARHRMRSRRGALRSGCRHFPRCRWNKITPARGALPALFVTLDGARSRCVSARPGGGIAPRVFSGVVPCANPNKRTAKAFSSRCKVPFSHGRRPQFLKPRFIGRLRAQRSAAEGIPREAGAAVARHAGGRIDGDSDARPPRSRTRLTFSTGRHSRQRISASSRVCRTPTGTTIRQPSARRRHNEKAHQRRGHQNRSNEQPHRPRARKCKRAGSIRPEGMSEELPEHRPVIVDAPAPKGKPKSCSKS